MNRHQMEGKWTELKGKIKEKWGKLTDDDLDVIEGRRDQLAGAITKRYGYAKEQAEQQVRDFSDALSRDPSCCP